MLVRPQIPALDHESRATIWSIRLGCLLLFVLMVFPDVRSVLYVKASLFALLLAFVVVQGLRGFHLDARVVAWTVGLSAVSLFFGLRGLVLGAPGALKCIQIYAFWPLVYLVLLSGIRTIRALQALEKTLLFSTAFTAVFVLAFISSELHFIPAIPGVNLLFTREELEGGFFLSATFSDGHIELGFPGLHACSFLVPFLLSAVIDRWFNSSKPWTTRV